MFYIQFGWKSLSFVYSYRKLFSLWGAVDEWYLLLIKAFVIRYCYCLISRVLFSLGSRELNM